MSLPGIVFTSVFSANALLVYGFGLRPTLGRDGTPLHVRMLALGLVNLVLSSLVWLLENFLLRGLGLMALEPLLFAAFMAPLVRRLSRVAASGASRGVGAFSRAIDESAMSSLVFGIALLAARRGFGLGDALLASLGSLLGYGAATILLAAIRERLELSDLPAPFRGAPAVLLSAGLMAMAFMGLDAAILLNLGGR
jgi:electron transport complex protein RnfA